MIRPSAVPASCPRLIPIVLLLALIVSACGQASTGGDTTAASGAPASAAADASSAAAASSAPDAASPAASSDAVVGGAPTDAGTLVFLSTQFKPVEEAERMRTTILGNFPGQVEFIPEDTGPFNDRIRAEAQAGQKTVSLIGGLHGDFAPFVKDQLLEDVTPLVDQLKAQGYPEAFIELSRLGTDKSYYVPWMQGTYLLAANKQALQYLPEGADQNALTYEQLKQWGANVQQATGERKLGFPGGPTGLLHRFFQGYLYPSYTGSAGVVGFKSPEAVQMWNDFKALWALSNPGSTTYEFMQEPLLSGEVWIAWDNAARLINAVKEKPDEFVLMPAPAGPKGRGFMPVLAGLAIPKGAPNRQGAEQLITYLNQPEQQIATLRANAFFPVTGATIPNDLEAGVRLEAEAVKAQSGAGDALPSLLPVGLGAKGGEFNKVYLDTFQRIVLNNEPVEQVLEQQAGALQQIINDVQAGCWPPDPPSEGPCQVK
jgi:multiple sugar transport system substrate-binding protein